MLPCVTLIPELAATLTDDLEPQPQPLAHTVLETAHNNRLLNDGMLMIYLMLCVHQLKKSDGCMSYRSPCGRGRDQDGGDTKQKTDERWA